MSRELNHELFAPSPAPISESAVNERRFEAKMEDLKIDPFAEPRTSPDNLRLLAHTIDTLKRRLKDYDHKIEALGGRVTEMAGALKSRVERMASAHHRIEEMVKISTQDINSKFAQLTGRVAERRVHDTKVEELVDRHNQVLNQFEVRLGQLQKIINEQEMQLLNSRSALQEALREITRLKKM